MLPRVCPPCATLSAAYERITTPTHITGHGLKFLHALGPMLDAN